VRELSGTARTWHWTAAPPPGLTVTPASGDLTVAAGAKARADVTVSVAPGTAEGSYPVPVTLTSTGQPALPATLGVLVAPHGSWPATVNNAGISPDAKPAAANFDGLGDSYSSDALAAAGARPGGTVTVDGLSYSLPDFPAEEPDNVLAKRQTVTVGQRAAGLPRCRGQRERLRHGDDHLHRRGQRRRGSGSRTGRWVGAVRSRLSGTAPRSPRPTATASAVIHNRSTPTCSPPPRSRWPRANRSPA
jgi:hypothetical protein